MFSNDKKKTMRLKFTEDIDTLRKWREIGQEFDYLGRRMVVASHIYVSVYEDDGAVTPRLTARYVDNSGVFHELTFSTPESLALARGVSGHDPARPD